MLRLPLVKLNKLVKSLIGDYIDNALLSDEVPFILIWSSTRPKSMKSYQSCNSMLYLIDLISLKVIYEPLKINHYITAIYGNHTPIAYDYKTEDGINEEYSICIKWFISEELCYKSNNNIKKYQLQNPYEFYINEVLNLFEMVESLPSPDIRSSVGIESFTKQIKDIRVEVRQTLKDKVNNYPFKLIKDVENTY